MRRLPGTKRTPIALVAALVLLSALLGDATAGQVASAETSPSATTRELLVCESAPARSIAQPATAASPWVEPGPGAAPRYLAGVPPWTIWPPAPVPRIGGAVIHPSVARSRLIVNLLAMRDACAADPAPVAKPGAAHASPDWPEPFRPLERLAGVEQRFPRPPPN